MTDPDDMPPLCRFAESLVIPRIARVETDVQTNARDIDAAHTQIRAACSEIKTVALEHTEHRRRITALESGMSSAANEIVKTRADIAELKMRTDAIFERLHDISTGIADMRRRDEAHEVKLDAQHRERVRQSLTIWGVLAGLLVIFTALHQSFTGVNVLDSLKLLIGVKP